MQPHVLEENFLSTDDVLLVPSYGGLISRSEADLEPFIYSAPMDRVTGHTMTQALLELGEFPVVSRFLPPKERAKCLEDFHSTDAFFAIGGNRAGMESFLEELQALYDQGVENCQLNVAVDIAHGYSTMGVKVVQWLSEQPFVNYVMCGSIATPLAATRLVRAGATHLRVGIGPGSMCTTRLQTGVGVPNLSAVWHINKLLKDVAMRDEVHIIADGGIRYPGDAVKYLAAGADGVMLGSVLSKTGESPGWEERQQKHTDEHGMTHTYTEHYKTYRGQASAEFQKDFKGAAHACPEGASSREIVWDGMATAETVVQQFRGGVSSAISYLGISSMGELVPEKVEMIRITPAGYREGTDHGNR